MARKEKKTRQHGYESKVLKQLVGTLETALSEDADDIDGLLNVSNMSGMLERPKPVRRRLYIVIGVVALFLSVVGLIATINFSSQVVKDIANKTKLKDEFARFVYPVVITDPPEFENNQGIPSSNVISSAIWRILISGKTSHYEQSMGTITIPAVDVEHSARSLFGTGFEITHQSIDDIEIAFDYYSETNSYIVPAQIRYMTYTPQIDSVSRVGDLYTLTVSYISPSPLSIAGIEFENTSVKSMIYSVSRSGNKMTVNSVKYAVKPLGVNQIQGK